MEKSNIINLAEKRKQKEEQKKKTTSAEILSGESIFIPEAPLEITEKEALALARDVVVKYSDPEILFQDFAKTEHTEIWQLGHRTLTNEEMRKGMESDLAAQRSEAQYKKKEELLAAFNRYNKSAVRHIYATKIFAYAEALIRKLGPVAV